MSEVLDELVIANVTAATMDDRGQELILIKNAGVAIQKNEIGWVGPMEDLPRKFRKNEQMNCEGRLLTSGLIDCHTHIVHGGERSREFEMRMEGESYENIAREGGGIVSTVSATRQASDAELYDSAVHRIERLLEEGVTTVEIKSGYGLDTDTELRMLRTALDIVKHNKVDVRTSFLGAHAVPPGEDADQYVDEVCIPALKAAHAESLVDAVDGFCEVIAFTTSQMERVFDCAVQLNLPVKLHAEQLTRIGGAQLAARYNALSADHLEFANEADAQALAQAGTVAVLLPGAFYSLRCEQIPPIQAFRDHGTAMAVATDNNPGSSPLNSILLAMNMACVVFGLSPTEAFAGVTLNAAKALGLEDRGRIAPGLRGDFAIWDADSIAELPYRMGHSPLHARITVE